MIIYVSLLISVIGMLTYARATSPKLVEIGRIAFACGLLAFLLEIERVVYVIGHYVP